MRRNFRLSVGLAASALALAFAAPTLAQGPTGGGGGGGGGGVPVPAPASGSCAHITALTNPNGYYSIWAAIWTHYSIASTCGRTISWRLTYTNGTTGAVDFVRDGSMFTSTASGIVDEDWAALATTYTVNLTVTDQDGTVLDSQSAVVTTKSGKTPGA